MNKVFWFSCMFSITLSGCTSSSVQGVIRDKDSGTPIPSAHVLIKQETTTSDALGHYKIRGPFFPGDTMMVNAPSYNIYTRTIRSINEIIDIELSKK